MLRTHVIPDAKILALRLSCRSDIAFAGLTEKTMAIAPDIIEKMLIELCRFRIEAADLAREVAPYRAPDAAAYEQACAMAALDTLRHAIHLRDRESAREPLRGVAGRLGIELDEADPDWQRLAMRALRVRLEAQDENIRRDQGHSNDRSNAFLSALSRVDGVFVRKIAAASGPVVPISPSPHGPPVSVTAAAPCAPSALPQPVSVRTVQPLAEAVSSVQARSEAAVPRIQLPTPTSTAATSCPTTTEAMETYIDLRSKGYTSFKPTEQVSKTAGSSWAKNSAPNVRSTRRLLARIFGDRVFDQIGPDNLTMAWELIARLPRSYQSKTSKLSPEQAADQADETDCHNAEITRAQMQKNAESPRKIESEILKQRIARLRTATTYRHMQDFQRICVFLKKTHLLSSNIMEDHIWDSAECERRQILEEDNKRQTWCGKTDGLFRSPIFQDWLEDVGDPMFWAPLLAIHMGLRSEEILRLYLSDVQIFDGVPCIVLRQEPGQSLKCRASRRTIAIHENLLKLGFMTLVAMHERAGEPRLFPWIERSQNKKTYTETFSKRFTRYRQDHKIYDTQRDFHSLRTTFNHVMIEAECPDTQRRALMGHVERDIGITNYNPDEFSKALMAKRVNLVVIDISMIRRPFETMEVASVTRLQTH